MTFGRQARRIAALPAQLAAIVRHPLNRDEPFRALWRWLRWQVSSRALGPRVVPFVGGTVLYGEPGLAGMTGNIYYGLAEYEDMFFVLRLLRPDDLFVDVGANVGSYTVLASGVAGARTHAFEPIERAFDVLGRNVRMNGIEGLVTLHRSAVGSRKGTVVMSAEHDTMNRVLDGESRGVTVPLVTLSEALAGLDPVLIKSDVEGYEADVLSGADGVLSEESLIALIVETASQAVAALLAGYGFQPFRYDPLKPAMTRLAGLDSRGNTLFIRDLAFVEARLASAPPVTLHDRTYFAKDKR